MSKSPRTPKNTVNVRRSRSIEIGDELTIRVRVTGKRTMRPTEAAVEYEMVTVQIPGHRTPVTVPADYLLGKEDADA